MLSLLERGGGEVGGGGTLMLSVLRVSASILEIQAPTPTTTAFVASFLSEEGGLVVFLRAGSYGPEKDGWEIEIRRSKHS